MRLGIICPSEIAMRRFMPAIEQIPELKFVGIGVCSATERYGNSVVDTEKAQAAISSQRERAEQFISMYGGKIYDSYESLVTSGEIDCVYVPLPPALHYRWTRKAILAGKHVLVEKPATISYEESKELVALARQYGVALHENYMFAFHKQLTAIDDLVKSGEIGEVRLYRVSFGFPMRQADDFRYKAELGGGALIDACGYTIKYASMLLGEDAYVQYAQMNHLEGFEVDMYGSGALSNPSGTTVQIAYGMDNNYKCELEVWGSKGCLSTGRVLTAPVGFEPDVIIRKGNVDEVRKLPADDAFGKSIHRFLSCIEDTEVRKKNYEEILLQAKLVEQFRVKAGENDR